MFTYHENLLMLRAERNRAERWRDISFPKQSYSPLAPALPPLFIAFALYSLLKSPQKAKICPFCDLIT